MQFILEPILIKFCNLWKTIKHLLIGSINKRLTKVEKKYEIKAVAAAQVEDIIEKDAPDCILIGPQIKYMEDQLKADASKHDILLEAIGGQDYGTMNGKNVIAQAERLLG